MTAPRPSPLPQVLIVDDSAVARAAMARVVGESGRFAVAGMVAGPRQALAFLDARRVDVILLDLEMPQASGIDALPQLLARGAGAKVLIVSSAAADGAAVTIRALALGAADTLVKPVAGGIARRFGEALLAKLDALAATTAAAPVLPPAPRAAPRFDIVAIGASTGGIHALAGLLGELPATFVPPVVVTQHLPASFSGVFAAQVASSARRPCHVARDRTRLRAGEVVIAPGDAHVVLVPLPDGGAAIRLSTAPSRTGNLPSVDPMLTSLADGFGARALAIVLSGMGQDGLDGARAVRARGGTVLVQDAATSVVWGMPGAVAQEGLANAILTPAQLGAHLALHGARA